MDLSQGLPVIATERLLLRQLCDSDVDDLYEIFSDPQVMMYWGFERFTSLEEAEALLDDVEQGRLNSSFLQWGISLKESDRVIGTTSIYAWDRANRRAELGFALRHDCWGNGYGLESARATVEFGFGQLDLNRFEADADPRNQPSLRILRRLGFKEEGYLRERYVVEGDVQDAVMMGLLKKEWNSESP